MEQDAELEYDILQVTKIGNQFERREGWRKLAGRIARISVSLWAKQGFKPESIANECHGQWILRQGYYASSQGLLVGGYPLIL